MAIISGSLCMNCDKKAARQYSHYCSVKCGAAFAQRMQGPVRCIDCGTEECGIREARMAGWKKISPDPEGISHNYSGYCQECAKGYSSGP